ncbi:MAG: DUF6356 family protein [Alphaproteobacteria bacterium]
MKLKLKAFFTQHPSSVGETYLEHFGVALSFAGILAFAAFAAVVHAIFPALFEKTASECIKRLHKRITSRGDEASSSTSVRVS